jgi:hypothetical protein
MVKVEVKKNLNGKIHTLLVRQNYFFLSGLILRRHIMIFRTLLQLYMNTKIQKSTNLLKKPFLSTFLEKRTKTLKLQFFRLKLMIEKFILFNVLLVNINFFIIKF